LRLSVFKALSMTIAGGVLAGLASAQPAWPDRPIQLIVPFPAGGGVDVIDRNSDGVAHGTRTLPSPA